MIEIKETNNLVEFKELDNLDVFEVDEVMYFKIPEITFSDCRYPAGGAVVVKSQCTFNALQIERCGLFNSYSTFKPKSLVKKLDAKLEIKR